MAVYIPERINNPPRIVDKLGVSDRNIAAAPVARTGSAITAIATVVAVTWASDQFSSEWPIACGTNPKINIHKYVSEE